MSKSKVARETRAPKKRAEKPLPKGRIEAAAKRAGIDPELDSTRITVMRGDVELAVSEVSAAFEEIFEAEVLTTGAEHDHFVMSALRRLRNVQSLLGCELQTDGAL